MKKTKLKLVLEAMGISDECLMDEAYRKFKLDREDTYDLIYDKMRFGLNEKFIFASCLNICYKDFN